MASLMDFLMAQRGMSAGSPDYTLGNRGGIQPAGSPFSPDGRLGSMGMRNMMNAQRNLANAATPAPQRVAPPRELFDVLSSYGAGSPLSQPPATPMQRPPMMMSAGLPMALQPQAQTPPMALPASPPLPPPRPVMPAAPAGAPMQLASAAPATVRESFMQRLLSGPNYQSNSMPVVMQPQGPMVSGAPLPQQVNWGDPESAADFFRADQAARQLGLLG
jgi:hypothetical protein